MKWLWNRLFRKQNRAPRLDRYLWRCPEEGDWMDWQW